MPINNKTKQNKHNSKNNTSLRDFCEHISTINQTEAEILRLKMAASVVLVSRECSSIDCLKSFQIISVNGVKKWEKEINWKEMEIMKER